MTSPVVLGLGELGGEEGVDEGRLSESRLAWTRKDKIGPRAEKEAVSFELATGRHPRPDARPSSLKHLELPIDETLLTDDHEGEVLIGHRVRGDRMAEVSPSRQVKDGPSRQQRKAPSARRAEQGMGKVQLLTAPRLATILCLWLGRLAGQA